MNRGKRRSLKFQLKYLPHYCYCCSISCSTKRGSVLHQTVEAGERGSVQCLPEVGQLHLHLGHPCHYAVSTSGHHHGSVATLSISSFSTFPSAFDEVKGESH